MKKKTRMRVYRVTVIIMVYVLAVNAYEPRQNTYIVKAENKKMARREIIKELVEKNIKNFRIEKVKRLWKVR